MSAKTKDSKNTQEPEAPAPAPAPAEPTGASVYALYVEAAGGKSHRAEPLPVGFDDLTEERQGVWDRFAAALNS